MPKMPKQQVNNVEQASDTQKILFARTEELLESIEQSIAMSVGNVFFGETNVTNFEKLKSKATNKTSVSNSFIYTGLKNIQTSIDNLFSKDNKSYKDTYKFLKESSIALSKLSSKTFMDPIVDSAKSISTLNNQPKKKEKKKEESTIEIILKNIDKKSVDSLIQLANTKITKDSMLNKNMLRNFIEVLTNLSKVDLSLLTSAFKDISNIDSKKLKKGIRELINSTSDLSEYYIKLDELFKQQVITSASAQQAIKANQIILQALKQTEEVAVKSDNAAKLSSAGSINMGAVNKFIVVCGFTMLIGALFMMIPGMVKNALMFGLTLSVFITAVLAPIAILGKFGNKEIFESVHKLSDFVFTCGIVMSLGALFMMIPGMVKNSLLFGATLGLFILAVLAPISIMSLFAKKETMESVKHLKGFVFTCGIIMLLGALFMKIPGLLKSSLLFGVSLGLFIAAVLAPIMFFSIIRGKVMDGIKSLNGLLITCTALMLFGALFVNLGGGKIIHNAIVFGIMLGVFIAAVLFPIMVVSAIAKNALESIGSIKSLIITCTILMLLGALFVSNKELVKKSLLFGVVLMTFITLVLIPILLYSILDKHARKTIVALLALIVVTTIVLMVGAYFMSKKDWWWRSLAFTLILGVFIIGICAAYKAGAKIIGNSILVAQQLLLLIGISTLALVAGVWAVNKYGFWNMVGFALILAGFIFAITKTYALSSKLIGKSILDAKNLALLVGISAGVLILGAWTIHTLGWDEILGFAALLFAFVAGLIGVYAYAESKLTTIRKGKLAINELALGVLAISGAILIMSVAQRIAGGWLNLLGDVVLLGLITVGLISIFIIADKLKKEITKGTLAIKELALGMLAISGAILIMTMAQQIAGGPGQLALDAVILAGTVAVLIGICVLASKKINDITKGALAIAAIGIGMTLLGNAILIMTIAQQIAGGPGQLALDVVILAGTVLVLTGMFFLLSKVLPQVTIGNISLLEISIGVGLISASILILAVAANIVGGVKNLGILVSEFLLVVVGLAALFGVLAIAIVPIEIGTISAGLLSVGLMGISVALYLLNSAIAAGGGIENSIKNATELGTIIENLTTSFNKLPSPITLLKYAAKATLFYVPISAISGAIYRMSKALDYYNKVKPLKVDELQTSMSTFLSLPDVVMKDIKKDSLLSTMSDLLELMDKMKDIVSKATGMIEDYAALKIPTAWNNDGVAIKYRLLKAKDFEEAANGVKNIITILAAAIKTTWDTNTWLGDATMYNILHKVNDLSRYESYILSRLCVALQDYAELKIPIKWNSDGVAIAYRPMTETDFVNAGKGVNVVLTTLAKGIKETYYGEDTKSLFSNDFENILERIVQLSQTEGEVLSTLSQGLQEYAKLSIADKWNKDGKPIHFREMNETDFVNAGNNIGTVMTLMAGAISAVWTGNDYETKVLGKAVKFKGPKDGLKNLDNSWFGGDSLADIMNKLKPMGELISSMAVGLQQYAKLQIATDWNKNGQPISFREMKEEDFISATKNIGTVIMAMASIVKASWAGGDVDLFGRKFHIGTGIKEYMDADEFKKVVESMCPIGTLISSIAEGIQSYAELKMPVSWDSNGKPNAYLKLDPTVFENAAIHTADVLKLMSHVILACWTGGTVDVAGKQLNLGKGLKEEFDSDEFAKIMNGFAGIGGLISSIASGLKDYAELKIPNGWDSNGNPTSYLTMNDGVFDAAGENISRILMGILVGNQNGTKLDSSTIKSCTTGIIGAYNIINEIGLTDTIGQVIESLNPIGELISSIANGIKAYAELRIPIAWDNNGNPTQYSQLSAQDFKSASNNIVTVLTTFVGAIKQYSTSENSASTLFIGGENSTFGETVKGLSTIGELIKNTAEGINAYASGTIPIKWNKEGKPIEFRTLTEDDYINAAVNINTVLSVIGKSIIDFATTHEDWFDIDKDSKDNKFKATVDSLSNIGNIVKNIADGINTYAQGGIPIWKNGKIVGYNQFNDTYFEKAATNIGKVITCVGNSILDLYNSPDFTTKFGQDGQFGKAIDEISKMGSAVKGIAEAIQAYADLKIPIKWDKNGKPTKFIKMDNTYFAQAKSNIAELICSIGTSILTAYDGSNDKDQVISKNGLVTLNKIEEELLNEINTKIKTIGSIVKTAGSLLESFASLKIPTGFDKNGNVTGYKKLDTTEISTAKTNIQNILTYLPTAIISAYNTISASNSAENINKSINTINTILTSVSAVIGSTVRVLKTINNDQKEFESIFSYTPKYKTGGEQKQNFVIGIFSDIYGILTEVNSLNSIISAMNITTIAEDKLSNIVNSIHNLSSIINPLLSFINNTTKGIGTIDTNNLKISGKIKSILTDVNGILDELSKLISNSKDGKSSIAILSKTENCDTIDDSIGNTKTILTTVFTLLETVNTAFNEKLKDVIEYYVSSSNNTEGYITSRIKPIINDINTTISAFQTLSNNDNNTDVSKLIYNTGKSLTVLGDGIYKVLWAINQAKDGAKFEKNINQLNKFIKNTINTLDIERIDKLTDLVCALNSLADKTTNLDELTNAIANDLTDVLKLLVEKMDEAKGTFQVMDELQVRRHNLINTSINNIKEIMSKQIEVHVTAEASGQSASTTDSQPDTATQQGGTPTTPGSGGGGGSVGTSNSPAQPNNKKPQQQVSQLHQRSNSATDAMIQDMYNTYKNNGRRFK